MLSHGSFNQLSFPYRDTRSEVKVFSEYVSAETRLLLCLVHTGRNVFDTLRKTMGDDVAQRVCSALFLMSDLDVSDEDWVSFEKYVRYIFSILPAPSPELVAQHWFLDVEQLLLKLRGAHSSLLNA